MCVRVVVPLLPRRLSIGANAKPVAKVQRLPTGPVAKACGLLRICTALLGTFHSQDWSILSAIEPVIVAPTNDSSGFY